MTEARKVMEKHIKSIRLCYEEALGKGSDLPKETVFTLTIDPKGRTMQVRMNDNEVKFDGLKNCLIGVMKRLAFASSKSGGTITVSFKLAA